MRSLAISSPAFENNRQIPKKYTGDGEDINPPLSIKGVPEGAKSLVLIMDDPDAPRRTWDHWIMWNIPPTDIIKEDSAPGVQGLNSWKKNAYGGPDPPFGVHRYFFKVYALDKSLNLDPDATKKDLERAIDGRVIAKGELMGTYGRA